MREEIVHRVAKLLLAGYSREQCVHELFSGTITTNKMTDKLANGIVDDAYNSLIIDIAEDGQLNYSRLLNLYKLCLEKKDFKTAQSVLKEMRAFNESSAAEVIKIEFIK